MRRFRAVVVVIGALTALGAAPAAQGADITPHRTNSAGFCAQWVRAGESTTDHWIVCGSRGEDSRQFGRKTQTWTDAWAFTATCANDGSTCAAWGFGGPIADDDLHFDADGLPDGLHTTLGPCAIDLTLAPAAASQTYDEHQFRLDGALITFERSGQNGARQAVTATGSACDWSEVASRPSDYGDRSNDHWNGISVTTVAP